MNSLLPWPVTPSWISSLIIRRSSIWAFWMARPKEENASGPMVDFAGCQRGDDRRRAFEAGRLGDVGLAVVLENVLLFEDERGQGGRHHHPADANLDRRGLRSGRAARTRKRGARGQGAKAEFTTIEPDLHDVSTCFQP